MLQDLLLINSSNKIDPRPIWNKPLISIGWRESYYSNNLVDWTKSNLITPSPDGIYDIAYGNGTHVCVSSVGDIYYSTNNGITWTKAINTGTSILNEVCYGAGKFVVVTYGGDIYYSTNGISWSMRSSALAKTDYNNFNSIIYANNQFIGVSSWGRLYTSPDGLTWTKRSNGIASNEYLRNIAYGNGIYVVTTQTPGKGLISTDSINWTQCNYPSANYFFEIISANDTFIAINNTGTIVQTSSDGINWTQQPLPTGMNITQLTSIDGLYIALNGYDIVTSVDLVNWQTTSTLLGRPNKIFYR